MQPTISTRISDQSKQYLEDNYKNVFNGARLMLEAFPVLHKEARKSLVRVFETDEIAFLISAHKGDKLTGKQLASRRHFEGYIADYWEENQKTYTDLDFPELVKKIRELGCFERLCVREIVYGIHTNPAIDDKVIDSLLF